MQWIAMHRIAPVALVLFFVMTVAAPAGEGRWEVSKAEAAGTLLVEKGGGVLNRWSVMGSDNEKVDLFRAALPVKQWRWHVRMVDRDGLLEPIYDAAGCAGELSVNGGFFARDSAGKVGPIGLVVADGKTTSRAAPWMQGGAFAAIEGETRVIPAPALRRPPRLQQAVQSKPVIIRSGRNDMNSVDGKLANVSSRVSCES